ncbi:hypothetical protein ACOQFV_24485 [Nocardiopsis changdeensis]|uniref:Uncharacterized protein n=1 Tax=Nocardiopsis changdeensis TaxID=2831969 RepID=A0A975KUW0_9ACTN|nr:MULTISPECIES: hypothetical protein [Nocardiopsis]QUX26451.1 hypothetical protein KGD84_32655 [Nocardiopsis changdeensis]QYX40723.1 hypothetical protein K1J57_32505 [Nocardiopsis sp. MT53]
MSDVDHILSAIRDSGFVAHEGRNGVIVYRAGVYDRFGTGITLTSWDGVTTGLEETACRALAQQLEGFRRATPEEIAEYERLEATRRPFRVRVTEEVKYEVTVRAQDAEEAEEAAIDLITEDGDRDRFCTEVTERYAQVLR